MASSPNTELMKVDLDTAAAEAKVRNLIGEIGKLATADPKKTDTGALASQITGEIEAISKSTGKTKEAQSAIDAVIKSKEKLGSVVAILGGQFGGFVGQLGNVVELFMRLGSAAALPAGILAGVTLLASAWHNASEEAKKAREEREKLADIEDRRKQAGKGAEQSIRQELEGAGVFGKSKAAAERARQLVSEEGQAGDMAKYQAIGEAMGMSPDAAAAYARGRLVTGESAPSRDPRERAQQVRRLQGIGLRQDAIDAAAAHRDEVAEESRQEAYSQQIRETSQTNYFPNLLKFAKEKGLTPDQRAALAAAIARPEGEIPSSDAKYAGTSEAETEALRREFESRGLRRTEEPVPQSQGVTVVIGTVYGTPNVHALPTSSVAQRQPGAASISRGP